MKVAAHVLAYNVNSFIKPVLENIAPHVDKIYIAHSELPYGYIEDSRLRKKNPTRISDLLEIIDKEKCEIVQGDWLTEEDMRNACLDRAKAEGFDWFIIQDADEFYPESSWKQIKDIFETNTTDDLLVTTWYNFWKSPEFVIMDPYGSIKGTNAGFALRVSPEVRFVKRRLANSKFRKVIDCPCYHYGYVMTDTEMAEKLVTWSHAKDGNTKDWYKFKWANWSEGTRNLNPAAPDSWLRAVRFPLYQPDFAYQFSFNITTDKKRSFNDIVGERIYDFKVSVRAFIKSVKILIKSFL